MRSRLPHAGPLVAVLCATVLLTTASLGGPGDAEVTALEATAESERVVLSFTLEGAFDDDVRRRIESGLPTGFEFDLRLQRDRKRWLDKDLAASSLQVVAMYNAVTQEYLINYKQDGALIESRVVSDGHALQDAMTRFEDLAVFPLADLPAAALERRLQVRVRAELGTKTILFLIPTKITTDWAESAKFRAGRRGS